MPMNSSPSCALNLSYGAMFGCALPSNRGESFEANQLDACGSNRLRAVSYNVASTRCPRPLACRACNAMRMPVRAT